MHKTSTSSITAAILVAAMGLAALPSHAALVVDTGAPNGLAVGSLAFDSLDWYAGEVNFLTASTINSVSAHVLGGTAGETFTVSLYAADGAGSSPGSLLQQATATFGADGWNGVSGLSGWNVAAGAYWFAFEVGSGDTLGSGSVTGALLDQGAAHPVSSTAFSSTGGSYSLTSPNPLGIGLRVDAVSAVPLPASAPLMLVGLSLAGLTLARRRHI